MSRVRTGHGPMDWSDNDGGRPAAASARIFVGGEMVQAAGPSMTDVQRERMRDKMRKYRARHKAVDMNDYPKERYANVPRCEAMLPIVGEPCARLAGHKNEHLSRAAMDGDRVRHRRWSAKQKAA